MQTHTHTIINTVEAKNPTNTAFHTKKEGNGIFKTHFTKKKHLYLKAQQSSSSKNTS